MQIIKIKKDNVGFRIDKFLVQKEASFSRGEIITKIKDGEVVVNSKKVKPSYILKEKDVLQIKNFSESKESKLIANNEIKLKIIFEDENVVVINKQAGIQVHPSHNEKTNTIANALIKYFPKIKNVHDESKDAFLRPGIVHRLDKDTSGVLAVAKNQKAFNELKKLFKDRKISKKYVAICEGIFAQKEGLIEKPIARSTSYRKQVIARENTLTKIRKAETRYKVIKEQDNFSVVEVFPKTGRMHQIRIHLASEGHPVVGDLVYGKNSSAKRQLLHAEELKFELLGKKYDFLASLPPDFKNFLANV
ncbi:MAG TPA: RluA family pseudouridine synthase [Candidatus Moranbacteria bacterium]|nr:RluA family pseudouridine synthase [Candidatus Moranbacteria bacterium]